ncbi:hypothetical protein F2Q70_00017014 [Brassica cretica]|uniref:Uncharacterized protein n=1 Tax=Brassica cretica TaxID=69181 RepID=A0A8S9HQ90_BRACR|nr:hypothetical protein F2Q70_00017014 [Brassica cretica]
MLLHHSSAVSLFLGGQERMMRWQTHGSGYAATGYTAKEKAVVETMHQLTLKINGVDKNKLYETKVWGAAKVELQGVAGVQACW